MENSDALTKAFNKPQFSAVFKIYFYFGKIISLYQ